MEKKRALMVNGLTIAAVLLLIVGVWLATELMPRKITPNAGVLEGFEPAQTTQQPEGVPSSHSMEESFAVCKEVNG